MEQCCGSSKRELFTAEAGAASDRPEGRPEYSVAMHLNKPDMYIAGNRLALRPGGVAVAGPGTPNRCFHAETLARHWLHISGDLKWVQEHNGLPGQKWKTEHKSPTGSAVSRGAMEGFNHSQIHSGTRGVIQSKGVLFPDIKERFDEEDDLALAFAGFDDYRISIHDGCLHLSKASSYYKVVVQFVFPDDRRDTL